MKRYLYISNSIKQLKFEKKTVTLTNMSLPYIKAARELGCEAWIGVDIIVNEVICPYDINYFNVGIYRSPLAIKDNYVAYKKLVSEIKHNNIDYIHCNTPVGGILGRLAGKRCKVKKVIYQAHGFHFYKGAPLINKLIYYPIEWWLARYTDAIITINREDFEAAQKLKLKKNGKVFYVPGVGIDTQRYAPNPDIRTAKRSELGVSDDNFVIVSVGRIEKNKNNEPLIRALTKVENRNVKLLFCGDGSQRELLEKLSIKLGVKKQVVFLGGRSDIREIYCAADALAMASFREGLSRTIMEAMASGLPCIVSKIRGNTDLVEDGVNGFLCSPTDVAAYSDAMNKLANDPETCKQIKLNNLEKIKQFDISFVEQEIRKIYEFLID